MRKANPDNAGEERPARRFLVHGASVEAAPLAAGLYVVATPIGNLGDITLRALAMLAGADVILAEDTRVSRTLLARYGIETPLSPYHEHNASEARPRALRRIAEGRALALISDAGTPLISDPGYKLVAEAVALGLAVTTAPGPSAALAALCVSRPAERSLFLRGFFAAPQCGATRANQCAGGHSLERSSSTRRQAASPRRSWTWRRNSATAPRRSHANLPSCTKRSARPARGVGGGICRRRAAEGGDRHRRRAGDGAARGGFRRSARR